MKYNENKSLKVKGNGIEISNTILSKEQKKRFEDFLNWKLKALDWWGESNFKLKGKVSVEQMISSGEYPICKYPFIRLRQSSTICS